MIGKVECHHVCELTSSVWVWPSVMGSSSAVGVALRMLRTQE